MNPAERERDEASPSRIRMLLAASGVLNRGSGSVIKWEGREAEELFPFGWQHIDSVLKATNEMLLISLVFMGFLKFLLVKP